MSAVVVALREIARRGNLSYTERHPAVVDAVELGGVISAADQAKVFQTSQQFDHPQEGWNEPRNLQTHH
jgi:hypothetical protein